MTRTRFFIDPSKSDQEILDAIEAMNQVSKHYGPGAHPGTGTTQEVHDPQTGGGGGADEHKGRHEQQQPSGVSQPEANASPPNPNTLDQPGGKGDVDLRPDSFDGYVGQEDVVQHVQIMMDSAKKRGAQLDHLVFAGPPGTGKTTIANIIAKQMGGNLHTVTGPAIRTPADMMGQLVTLQEGDILFIDEIHALPRNVQEILYPAMEDFQADIKIGDQVTRIPLPKFTLVGATTRLGDLEEPFRDRFGLQAELDYLDPVDINTLVQKSASKLSLDMEPEAGFAIANAARGTPRVANNLLEWVRDYSYAREGGGKITRDTVKKAFEVARIDNAGLTPDHRDYLRTVREFGIAGESTIAAKMGTDPVNIESIEDYLLREGFVAKTPRGRMLTQRGKDHLDQLSDFYKHYGPGAHASGTEQSVHGSGGRGTSSSGTSSSNKTEYAGIMEVINNNERELGLPNRPGIDDNYEVHKLAKNKWGEAYNIEQEVSPVLQDIATSTNGELLGTKYRLKTERSLRRKIIEDAVTLGIPYEQATANIHDAARWTFAWSDEDGQFGAHLETAVDKLKAAGWEVYDHKDKNFFANDNDFYDGINVQFTKDDNFIEVQFHTPASWDIKEESVKLRDKLRGGISGVERMKVLDDMKALWNRSRDHVPQSALTWGTPATAIMKGRQISLLKRQTYYVYSVDGETPLALFRVKGTDVEQYDFEAGSWGTTPYDITDLSGLGGATEFEQVSDKYAIELTRNGLGPDFSADVEIAKSDQYENLVFGWASVAFSKDGSQLIDKQGHAIDVDDLEKAAYNFSINHYGTGDMHSSDGFGELVESMVFTDEKIEALGLDPGSIQKGWWVGFKVPPEYHEQVRTGKRTMFSIEGTAKLEPYSD